MRQSLHGIIYQTITDISKWRDVLIALVDLTGALKGIITLRERSTACLVVPDDIRQELASPLVYGFSEEEVHSYISKYILHDPWTDIENLYHPDEAYSLSQHIDPEALRASLLWEWLEPQMISDSVVFKVGDSSSKYWVALNLYYDRKHSNVKRAIIDAISFYKKDIRSAWQLGQQIRLGHLHSDYVEYFLEQEEKPLFLINENRRVLKFNDSAKAYSGSVSLRQKEEKNILIIKSTVLKKQVDEIICNVVKKKNNTPMRVFHEKEVFNISLIRNSKSLLGEEENILQLVIADSSSTHSKWLYYWEHCHLTKRERELVEIMAKGGRVVDFKNHYKISKSTSHMHWQNVKSKLKIKDRSEIRAAYELFHQNL